jgi:phenylpropionate dioxygenase-like ring-hydroxylating dioxygenase large terminal subunit
MELIEKESLTRRLLEHIDNNTTDYAESVMVAPFNVFSDSELFAQEVAVARRQPHVVAHVSELPKPGDFITTELIGASVLVVRQTDGSVKAFSNTCRHRGARVEFDASGCKRIFSCPYHNWAYGREGALRALPHEGDFDGLDKSQYGLLEFPCEVRYGLVWVVPTVGGDIDIAGLLGEKHDAELFDTGINGAWQHRSETFDLEMNWKLAVDGVQDSYHLCQLHTTTVCPLLVGNVYALDVQPHGRSWRIVVARKTLEQIRGKDVTEVDVRDYTLANYTVFPGTMLVTEPAHFEIWTITPHPTDPTKCRTTIRLLSPSEPETDKQRRFFDKNWDLLMETLIDEDWWISKTITDNVDVSGVTELIYGRNELPSQHFHTQLAADVEALHASQA